MDRKHPGVPYPLVALQGCESPTAIENIELMFASCNVYEIVGGGLRYIGCTKRSDPSERWKEHIYISTTKNPLSSKRVFDAAGGHDNCKFNVLEKVSCKSYGELLMREKYWIDSLDCVNKKTVVACTACTCCTSPPSPVAPPELPALDLRIPTADEVDDYYSGRRTIADIHASWV
jgi:hypothetical protein